MTFYVLLQINHNKLYYYYCEVGVNMIVRKYAGSRSIIAARERVAPELSVAI